MTQVAESRESRAAALWVAREYDLDHDKISGVTFAVYSTDCETCGSYEAGIAFDYDGKHEQRELPNDMKTGHFIAACVALLSEIPE